MKSKFILSISGESLTDVETKVLDEYKNVISGVMLSRHNLQQMDRAVALCKAIKGISQSFMTFIDQEGGLVSRLTSTDTKPGLLPKYKTSVSIVAGVAKAEDKTPIDQIGDLGKNYDNWNFPPAEYYSALYNNDPAHALDAVFQMYKRMSAVLSDIGIDVAFAPVADLRCRNSFIDTRSFGTEGESGEVEVKKVVQLVTAAARGFSVNGIMSVLKHAPGHGQTVQDSHHMLCVTDQSCEQDISVFKLVVAASKRESIKLYGCMVAHVIYKYFDDLPATISRKIIKDIIVDRIGCDKNIIADDITMKGLMEMFSDVSSLTDRYVHAINATSAAGCNEIIFTEKSDVVLQVLRRLG